MRWCSTRKSISPPRPSTPARRLSIDLDVLDAHLRRAPQVHDHAGVDVAGAGAHHQALHRRQAHRRVHRAPADDRRRRRAVAQMQHDLVQRCQRHVQKLRRLLADVLVGGAVKPVPADVPLRGEVPVDGVRRRRGRQVVEERGVEHRDVRQIGQHLAGHPDTEHCGRIVQRRKRSQLLQLGDQRVVDERRPVEVRAAVHHPVPDRDQPDGVQMRARLGEQFERGPQRRLVVGDPIVAGRPPCRRRSGSPPTSPRRSARRCRRPARRPNQDPPVEISPTTSPS